jgi:tetratricopeptide (TPR) repeat protein
MKTIVLALLAVALAACATPALAETAAEAFAKGEKLLAKGDFQAAQQSYADAARADRRNQDYVQHYTMIRRVVDLRSRLETEQDPEQWEETARALHGFYVTEGLLSELLKLDLRMHARVNSTISAALLAETQLILGKNADAAKMLSELDSSKTTALTRALLGIALLRGGQKDQAREIVEKLVLSEEDGPGASYAVARLYAGVGNTSKALGLLKPCFEAIPGSLLEVYKTHAKSCPEFAAVASNEEFAGVLKTESKVPESKCSGGSSCSGCPMAAKCDKSDGKCEKNEGK